MNNLNHGLNEIHLDFILIISHELKSYLNAIKL